MTCLTDETDLDKEQSNDGRPVPAPFNGDQSPTLQVCQGPPFRPTANAVNPQHAVGELDGLALPLPVQVVQAQSDPICLASCSIEPLKPGPGDLDEVLPPLLDFPRHDCQLCQGFGCQPMLLQVGMRTNERMDSGWSERNKREAGVCSYASSRYRKMPCAESRRNTLLSAPAPDLH